MLRKSIGWMLTLIGVACIFIAVLQILASGYLPGAGIWLRNEEPIIVILAASVLVWQGKKFRRV